MLPSCRTIKRCCGGLLEVMGTPGSLGSTPPWAGKAGVGQRGSELVTTMDDASGGSSTALALPAPDCTAPETPTRALPAGSGAEAADLLCAEPPRRSSRCCTCCRRPLTEYGTGWAAVGSTHVTAVNAARTLALSLSEVLLSDEDLPGTRYRWLNCSLREA